MNRIRMQGGIRRLVRGAAAIGVCLVSLHAGAQIAVRGGTVHTMDGSAIKDGVVIIRDGRIAQVGPASQVRVPQGYRVIEAAVVTPGLIDARSVVGLAGQFNYEHDQDQLESSSPIQPDLRASDAYNAQERLIEWLRSFGVTAIHTGHAPGELISGQTIIVKLTGETMEQALVRDGAMVAATLGESARKQGSSSPGTRGKMMAMLRAELIKASEYVQKRERGETPDADDADDKNEGDDRRPGRGGGRDLKLEVLASVLQRERPMLITAHRAQDIMNAIRLAQEFQFNLVLDGCAEAHLLLDEIKASGYPVLLHPTMQRATGEAENLSMETASKLRAAGIPFAIQGGYESYVPKTRCVLFEAALAMAHGLAHEHALAAITIDAARILGLADRVGSITAGKDADLALYDGDPFEYTTHCIGVLINGQVVSEAKR